MNAQQYDYHYENLANMDPDDVVGELELTTEEILEAFPSRVDFYIRENYG